MPTSAGILVYKKLNGTFYFLLAHPGGPFYKNKDDGSWGIPKGLVEKEEEPFDAAKREFLEETSLVLPEGEYIALPVVKYKNGKVLLSWALRVDHLEISNFKSNTFEARWSTQSTELKTFDEIDALVFFELTIAQQKIHPVQLPLIDFITHV